MKTKSSEHIVDLIEYRLKKYIETFHQGTPDWDFATRILFMYLCDDITVKWDSQGIIITQTRIDGETERLLLSDKGPIMNAISLDKE